MVCPRTGTGDEEIHLNVFPMGSTALPWLPWFLISVGTLTLVLQFCRKELEGEPASPAGVVGDLDEAPQRLLVAQEDIQRVAEGLDAPSKEQSGAGKCCSGGHSWSVLSPGKWRGQPVLCSLCLECGKISARSQPAP